MRGLESCGIDLRTLSTVGKDSRTGEGVVCSYATGERMKTWGRTGAFWGGVWGLLSGSAFFFIPGIGPQLVAGPLVDWVVGGLEDAMKIGGAANGMRMLLPHEHAIRLGKDSWPPR